MDKPNLPEEKNSDGNAGVQKAPDVTEGNTLPTFINNWVPLPSTASGTTALGMGSTLNLNLPNFYQGGGGSVISGPPLLGGAMPSNGAPNNSTSTNGPTGISTNSRSEYLNMNNQSMPTNQRALPGAAAINNLSADSTGQRSHSNSFNGFSYSQHAYGTATGMPNTTGNLPSAGGLATNHIDFMNINNSPPLLSSASATSSGMFLTSLPGKSGDNMNMLNHQNIYGNMHNMLPSGSASYTNLSAYGNANTNNASEGVAGGAQVNNVGAKRPQPTPTAYSAAVSSAAGNANKKAKGAANRSRTTSAAAPNMEGQGVSTLPPLGGNSQPLLQQQQQQQLDQTNSMSSNNLSGMAVASARGGNPTSPVFDSTAGYSVASGGTNGGTAGTTTAPGQLLPQTTTTNLSNSNTTNISASGATTTMASTAPHNTVKMTGPAPPSSTTITYPIMAAYKSSSVMSTGLVSNYVPGGANYTTTTSLHPGQGMQNYVYNTTNNVSGPALTNNNYVGGAVGTAGSQVGMQNTSLNNSKLSNNNLSNQGVASDGTNRGYSYLPGNAANNGSNVNYQSQQMHAPLGQNNALPNQQNLNASHASAQHLQYSNNSIPSNLNYTSAGPAQGMTYNPQQQQSQLQQQSLHPSHQQQNSYLRPQPVLHSNNSNNSNMSNPSLQQGGNQMPLSGNNMYNSGHSNNNMMTTTGSNVGNNGGAVQLQNYPLNTMHGQGHLGNTYNNTGMNSMNNAMNNNSNMSINYNSLNTSTAQQQQQQAANNKAAPARARVRNKTPRPGKKALAGAATGPGDADGPPASVTDTNNQVPGAAVTRPMTYKEKRAASSKKAIAAAAAAAAAEAERNGDPAAASLLLQADTRRRDTKRDRDNSLVEGEAGRSEREKAEKEESTTALLKRREPIVSRIEDIEDSKFLGRKGPGFVPPPIAPVPSMLAQPIKSEEGWGESVEKPVVQARGLREDGQRPKTHWDFVLQEVQWMALDFRQELRWKVAASQRTAAACASSSSRCVLSARTSKLSPADATQARAVAKTLAQRVAAYWQQLTDNIASSGDHAACLRSLLAGASYMSESFSDSEQENVKPENINKWTDKILSLPSTIRGSDSGASLDDTSTAMSTKSAYFHSTPAASAGNAVVSLLPHQLAALELINALNVEKFGAVMHGKAYIGKTTAGCVLVKEWLQRREDAEENSSPVVVIVAERRCVFRWATELRSQQLPRVEVWSPSACAKSATTEDSSTSTGRVVVVSCDLLPSFLQSACYEMMSGIKKENVESLRMDVEESEELSVPRDVLQGVLVDRRCVSESPGSTPTATCAGGKRSVLGQLAAHLDGRLTRRCLIVEDAYIPGNVLESLNFLTPGTHYRDWAAKYPSAVAATTPAAAGEKETENHQEQIVSNTLNQLLSNLSVAMKLPNNADSVIAAQTRLEVVTPEMDSVQARLYYAVASHLARHPSICSGESTTKLAVALLLLQKTCFHAALLTHRGRGPAPSRHVHPEARFDDTQRSELDNNSDSYARDALNRTSGTAFASNALPMRSPPSYDLYWSNPAGEKGPGSQTPASMDYSYQESTFSRGVLCARDLSSTGNASALDQGSCKLQGLQRLLRRFAGLRVAVLMDTEDECALVSQLLKKLNVQHEVAFASSSSPDEGTLDAQLHNRTAELAGHWVASQKAVQVFNSPLNDTCVLLCSKHVFQPPNVPPQQADAVVILSDDWTHCTEVRDCFRLRLLSAGPTGPPLTVVRVAACGTIEERMARKSCSLLQLQGTPLSQLWAGVKYSPTLSNLPSTLNPSGFLNCPEPTLLSHAPMLVLPAAPKTLLSNAASPAPAGLLADGSRPGGDRSGSPMVVADGDASKRNSDSNLRGKGKGFIVLGRQGSTTFVKDNALGFSRGRTGVLPEAYLWSQRLRRDVASVMRQFDSRNCTITIYSSGNVFFSTDVTTHVSEKSRDDAENRDSKDKTVDSEGIICMLHRVFDQFVLGQAAALTSDTSSGLAKKALQSKLLCMLEAQLAIRFKDVHETSEVTTDGVEAPPAPAPVSRRSFGPLELQRLIASGLGKSEAEDALSQLMLPYQYDSLLPADCYKIKAEVDSSQHWPQSFLVFRDLLSEARRTGTPVDPVLFVNPLQTAHRGESISTNAFQRTTLPSESAISIKYLAEGARNASGASRSSKSRRSRPSASSSRRKDSVTSTNTAENADVSNVPVKAEGEIDIKSQNTAEVTFEVGFLSDLEPSGDTPQKAPAAIAPVPQRSLTTPLEKSPNPVQENSTIDSWHPTEDDIIICTQNAFSDTHFKRTENWLNRALEQSRRRRRTAAEARLRYTWLCTTGRTQQRLQDPLVVAQIEQLRFSVQQRVAAAAAATTATGPTVASPSLGSQLNSPYGSELNLSAAGGVGTPSFYPYPVNTNTTSFASPPESNQKQAGSNSEIPDVPSGVLF